MLLPKDPETLRVPAFMRKRGLAARDRRPLLLTALDRKKAGVLPLGVKLAGVKPKKVRRAVGRAGGKIINAKNLPSNQLQHYQNSLLDFLAAARDFAPARAAPIRKKTMTKRMAPRLKPKLKKRASAFAPPVLESFSEPIIDFEIPEISSVTPVRKKSKAIGIITHYYDKIKVGVIKLSGTLSVGDSMIYETDEGLFEQLVESMEIDRQPVFKAGKGEEVGIKLKRKTSVDSKVFFRA